MSYVTHQRIELFFGISAPSGAPQELTLELQDNLQQITLVAVPDPRIVLVGDEYVYSFVALDKDMGFWVYRWWGKDSTGEEFAWPPDTHWQTISIL
jgi:hypothetical protein